MHDFGDCESADTRIVYEPAPESGALFGTFNFDRAHHLVQAVEKEPRFREAVDRSAEAWARLAAARVGDASYM